jgi:hypothetical protein
MRAALAVLALGLLGAVAASVGPAASEPSACAPPLIGAGAIGEGRNNPDLMPPTTGRLRILALFVDFPDAPGPASGTSSARPSEPPIRRSTSRGSTPSI